MAFVSIIFGTIFGLFSAVTGAVFFDLAFWQSLLVYSGSGVFFTMLAITALVLRTSSDAGLQAAPGRANAL